MRGRSAVISRPLPHVHNPRKVTVSQQLCLYTSAHVDFICHRGHLLFLDVSETDGVCILTLAGSGEACRRPWEDKPGVWWRRAYRKLCPPPSSGSAPLCGKDVNLPDLDWVKAPCFETHACKCSTITLKVTSYSNGAFRSDRGRFFFFFLKRSTSG